MSCYSHPCAADGPSTSRGTEPAPAWDEMPSILPCFWSANCFLCELPVHSPGCSCGSRDTVSQHCPAAPKATASHPHSARTWNRSTDTNSQNPAPIQALLPWSQGHRQVTSRSKCWCPQLCQSSHSCDKGTGKCEWRSQRTLAVKLGSIRMTLLSPTLAARCGYRGQS